MCFCCRVLRSFTPAIRFYCRVLRSSTPAIRFYLECPAFGFALLLQRPALVHACLFSFVRKKSGLRYVPFLFRVPSHAAFCVRLCASVGMSCVRPCATVAASCARPRLSFFLCQEKRSGLRYVSFLFREVEIAICKFSCLLMVIGLCWFTSGLRVSLWRFRRGYGGRGERRDAGVRSWRRGVRTLLREPIGFAVFSTGSTLGLRAPDCAKESSTLWTLFTLRRVMLAGIRLAVTRVYGKT